MSGDPDDGHVTWKDFIERFDKSDARILRIERAVLVLLILTVSPKLGGPSAPQLISALLGV